MEKKKKVKERKYVSVIWLVTILALVTLGYTIVSNNINQKIIDFSRQENSKRLRILELEKEEKDLNDSIALAQTDAFIEYEARTKYGYLRPGEIRFIITNPESLYGEEAAIAEIIQ